MDKKRRHLLSTIANFQLIFLMFCGTLGLTIENDFWSRRNFLNTHLVVYKLICISAILMPLMWYGWRYLRGDLFIINGSSEENSRRNFYLTEELMMTIADLQKSMKAFKDDAKRNADTRIETLTETDKEKLFNIITKTVSANITTEFLNTLEVKYSSKLIGESRYQELLKDFAQTRDRLTKEIHSLSRRADLNLMIGSITTLIAVAVLFTSIYGKSISFDDVSKLLSHFIPRITTIVFIEVFSFFFLKLYRNNLNDVKYYQNEMTNIEFKILSLKSALMSEDKEMLKEIISEIGKTERNFVLQKGETTAEIESSKSHNRFDKSFTDNLKSLSEVMAKIRGKE